MSKIKRKNIFFPVETINREMLSKLWIGCVLSKKGYRVFIGSKAEIDKVIQSQAGGVYLEKSLQNGIYRKLTTYKNYGVKLANLCEEGLMFFSPQDYTNRKLGKKEIELIDKIFCWGENQKNAISKIYPEHSSKLVITGNPRTALCSERFYSNFSTPRKRGSYILLNTKFARTNYIDVNRDNKYEWVEKQIEKGYCDTSEQKLLMKKSVDQEKHVLEGFVNLVKNYDKYGPNELLVLRPHPAEDFLFWEQITRDCSRVVVEHKGEVGISIANAKMVISNNCTTNLEAVLMGIPSVNYRPYVSESVEYEIPKNIGLQVQDEVKLFEIMKNDEIEKDNRHEIYLEKHIKLFSTNYFDRICEEINALADDVPATSYICRKELIFDKLISVIHFFKNILRFLLKKEDLPSVKRHRQKFPGIPRKYVNDMADQLLNQGLIYDKPKIFFKNKRMIILESFK